AGDGGARDLFGRGLLGGGWRPGFQSQHRRHSFLSFAFQQLCDTKVQQSYLPFSAYQHVRRFYVSMYDQLRVRVCNCIEYIEEEPDTRFYIELALVTVPVDRFTFNVLNHQVWMSGG